MMKTYPHMVPRLSPSELDAFYPNALPGQQGNGKWAERRLYEVMDKCLPQDWVIVCNTYVEVKFVQHDIGRMRLAEAKPSHISFHENQLDFLVFVPNLGVVNVDAKGGTYAISGLNECRENGCSATINHGENYVVMCGGRPGRNVFDQAKSAIHTVDEFIRQEILHMRPGQKGWGNFADLVTFVSEDFSDSAKPQGVEYATYTDLQGNADGLRKKIVSVLGKHKYTPHDASGEFGRYMEQILDVFARVAKEGVAYSNEYQVVDSAAERALGQEQIAVYHELMRANSKYFHISAGAGTGKTVLAKKIAEHYVGEGKRVLYVCYNKKLAEDLELSWHRPICEKCTTAMLAVSDFHSLPRILLADTKDRKCNLIQTGNSGFDRKRTDEVFLRNLPELCRGNSVPSPDVIIVDEAQDLSRNALTCLGRLLRNRNGSRMFFFSDSGQLIFRQEDDWTIEQIKSLYEGIVEPRTKLDRNYRNTELIVYEFRQHVDTRVFPRIMEGFVEVDGRPFTPKKVEKYQVAPEEVHDVAMRCIQGFISDGKAKHQIALLAFHEETLKSFKRLECADGSRIVFSCGFREWRSNEVILKTSVQSFKGLEADCIVLIDDLELDENDGKKLRYVAKSRAKYELIVIGKNKE